MLTSEEMNKIIKCLRIGTALVFDIRDYPDMYSKEFDIKMDAIHEFVSKLQELQPRRSCRTL